MVNRVALQHFGKTIYISVDWLIVHPHIPRQIAQLNRSKNVAKKPMQLFGSLSLWILLYLLFVLTMHYSDSFDSHLWTAFFFLVVRHTRDPLPDGMLILFTVALVTTGAQSATASRPQRTQTLTSQCASITAELHQAGRFRIVWSSYRGSLAEKSLILSDLSQCYIIFKVSFVLGGMFFPGWA